MSTKFVVVIFTEVKVPATNKSPDKLKLEPLMVVAESHDEETVAKVPIVE